MPDTTDTVWTLATDTLCEGWTTGTITVDDQDYAEVYVTRTEAERELADLIRERLTQFIENPEYYDGITDALNSGFDVVEAAMRHDGTILIDGEVKGIAPPAVRAMLLPEASTPRKQKTC